MLTTVSDGFYDFGILDPWSFAEFEDEASALQYFRPMLSNPAAVEHLRRLMDSSGLPSRSRKSDEEILRDFSRLVADGRFRVAKLGETMKTVPGKKPEPPPPPPSETASTAKQPPKETSDAAGIDASDQADTLKRASEDGKPFCEECEKARKEQEASGAAK